MMLTTPGNVVKSEEAYTFCFTNAHVVPWKYEVKVETTGSSFAHTINQDEQSHAIPNIVVLRRITGRGRCYGKKEKKDIRATKVKEKEDDSLNIMKQSEYDIVEQLKMTLARISLLSLILSFEPYRRAPQNVLNEAYVKPNVTLEDLMSMVDWWTE